ncbi:non-hydrolyzing UDP-N-acetylglucosamine 2-epimerase [Planomonospora venezuelensis]|uniref:UDP-N-acetylglucosamine 2-epimerase (Non-hydrolyzing) n=1 Tax=Planomonospora venezuelensis TaxID=1999 RepID=A0A841CXG6_PLAVE|nr:UDP-N-acetylglucosamine 2-epimerase (non-hydrolyzing) [Planomonospora venezuelensis]MBB5961014.1 UDP-N-acetylglucosamine 2-epimerase (non-hydrolyzing) [Planomonospora venezuelensis]GIN03497.1 UDP-N-acetyl glucosamine 2-epimerase [Planomonospora venezuelensis]
MRDSAPSQAAPAPEKAPENPLVLHVLGARPNFVKAAPVVRGLTDLGVRQGIVHTGQHYDALMSDVFFADLGLPDPVANLGVGSGSHARQTAALLTGLEEVVLEHGPALVVVYGDVNSTLAAILVCAKLGVPTAHVEAGLRSFDRGMPEEVNRVVTDALSDILFATSPDALSHLSNEGVDPARVHLVGNPMIDSLFSALDRLDPAPVRERLSLPERYGVATLHRPANVDDPAAAKELVDAVLQVGERLPIVVPIHPRGRERLAAAGLVTGGNLLIVDPLGYVDFLSLVRGATLVVTDSGGVQEETTMLGVPCLTVRPNTERPVTVTHGTNRLVTPALLPAAADKALADGAATPSGELPPLWDGKAGPRIARVIASWLAGENLSPASQAVPPKSL